MTGLQLLAMQKAQERNLDPDFVNRLIRQESRWDPNAISPVGARGIMQIMPATGRDLGLMTTADLMDPVKNIDAGTRYLAQLSKRYGGDEAKIAAAYNWGMGNVPLKGPLDFSRMPAETRNYVRKITGITSGGSATAPNPPTMLPAPRRTELRTAPPISTLESIYSYLFGTENEGLPPAKSWPGPELGLPPEQLSTGDLASLGLMGLTGMGTLPALAKAAPRIVMSDPVMAALNLGAGTAGGMVGGEIGEALGGDVGRNIGAGIGGLAGVPRKALPRKDIMAIPPEGILAGTQVLNREGFAQPVYHGTPVSYDEFDLTKIKEPNALLYGPGHYFSTSPDLVATNYSRAQHLRDIEKRQLPVQKQARKLRRQAEGMRAELWSMVTTKDLESLKRRREFREVDLSPEATANLAPHQKSNLMYYIAEEKGAGYPFTNKYQQFVSKRDRAQMLEDKLRKYKERTEVERQNAPAPNVRPAYLNLKNIFDVDENLTADQVENFASAIERNYGRRIPPQLEEFARDLRMDAQDIRKSQFGWGPKGKQIYRSLENLTQDRGQVNEILENMGYDGITHIDDFPGRHGIDRVKNRTYIAFRNDQVIPAFDQRLTEAQQTEKWAWFKRRSNELRKQNKILRGQTITTEADPKSYGIIR